MDKKGAGDIAQKSVFYLISGVLLTLIFFVLVYVISSYVSISQSSPPGLEYRIFLERFVSSPYCFVFQDVDTGRSYPGVLDWDKFSNDSLDYCYESFVSGEKERSVFEKAFAPPDATYVSVKSRQSVVARVIPLRLTLSVAELSIQKSVSSKDWKGVVLESYGKDVLVLVDGKLRRGKLKFEVGKLE